MCPLIATASPLMSILMFLRSFPPIFDSFFRCEVVVTVTVYVLMGFLFLFPQGAAVCELGPHRHELLNPSLTKRGDIEIAFYHVETSLGRQFFNF